MNTPSTSIIVVLAFLGSSCGFGERESDRRQSIVQIRTRDGKIQGSGIVIQGPDQQADQFYVATLYEIINTGEPIVVDSFVPAPSSGAGKYFLQEYPNTEIVAYDAMSNAAIIHVKNVPADYIQPLVLSKAEEIVPQSRVHVLGVLENRTSDNRRVHDAEAIVTNTHTFHARDHFLGRDLPNELEGFSVDTPVQRGLPRRRRRRRRGRAHRHHRRPERLRPGRRALGPNSRVRHLRHPQGPGEDQQEC